MKIFTLYFSLILILSSSIYQHGFLNQQIKHDRVKVAYNEKGKLIKSKLSLSKIDWQQLQILTVAYKEESTLEVYVKNKKDRKFQLYKQYPICVKSGTLGPKRMEGDQQVPEGFYHINVFNPYSDFYLSLGINYPNKSDQILGNKNKLGNAIFIHGSCVSIGCLPMTDEAIKEIYLLNVFAKNANQTKIPVYIFPFRMDKNNSEKYFNLNIKNKTLLTFWKNIQSGYTLFNLKKQGLRITIDKTGSYIF
jgi:murein L,D-transpeptidase YafK